MPWVFIYRDPVEVLVSQLTKVSGRMLAGPMSAGYLRVPLLEALLIPQEDWCAWALGRIAEAVCREPVPGRVMNYSRLRGVLDDLVSSWMGGSLDAAGRQTIRDVARFHSKSPDRPFQADSEAKQLPAGEKLRFLAEHWVGPQYRELESLPR